MSWLLKGLLIGAGIALVGVAIVGTGGLAAVAIVGGAAAAGAGIGEVMSTMSFAAKEVVGTIIDGSLNVFIKGLKAARAHVDFTACSKHPNPPKLVATGSGNVYINAQPAARVGDKTQCSAEITKGASNVFIGGGTQQTDSIEPENLVPPAVHLALFVVGMGAALVLGGPVLAIGGLIGGIVGGVGGNWLGGKVFGEGSDGQKWSMLGGSFVGGFLGTKGAPGAWNFAKRIEVEPGTLGMNGGNLRLRPATAPVKGVSAEDYAKLRTRTPSKDIQAQVNAGVSLPMKDPVLPTMQITKSLHADHVVSMKNVTEMDGFNQLTFENQLKVLNNQENFVGLSEAANTSKGSKSFSEWTMHKKSGTAVDEAFRQSMIEREAAVAPLLEKQIGDLLKTQAVPQGR